MANSAANYRTACVTAKANLAAAITSDAPEGGNTANSPLAQHHVVLIAELDKVINTIDQGNT